MPRGRVSQLVQALSCGASTKRAARNKKSSWALSSASAPNSAVTQELTLYAHLVIDEAFRRSGAKFRTIKAAKILRTWESVSERVGSLKEYGRSAAGQHAEFTSEPAVFRYIVEAMDEPGGDNVILTDDEFWHMLCILHTVSDCLHEAKKTR
jgi:hypothetical protein